MLKKLTKKPLTKKSVKKFPETPGVYIFWQKDKTLYIGKAINLKKRVYSYLSTNLYSKTKNMIEDSDRVSYLEVTSELESLLLEAKLIKKYRPKYNIELKDDKQPLYIKITKEDYPRVLTARKKGEKAKNLAFFGPFPSSGNIRSVLKTLRRIFPYATHTPGKRGCIYSQIGLCDPCPSIIENEKDKEVKSKLYKEYKENLRQIKGVLSGRIRFVRDRMDKKMKILSKKNNFEKAAKLRDKIERLDYITQPVIPVDSFVENPNLAIDIREDELKKLTLLLKKHLNIKGKLTRIECYDVAHISGVHPTASMVTFIKGEPDKAFYRHFRIRQKKGADDVSSMREVAKRRKINLSSWGVPDLIVVDGGKTQVNAFLESFEKDIPIVGIAKREESLIVPSDGGFKKFRLLRGPAKNLVQRLRDEAHRFARRYHHKLLKKSLIPS
jgi:excinuclease ABC subunit C